MPALTVPDAITFEYMDSGHIDNVDYTTCIILHGHSFHGATFSRLFPYAKAHSLRIICVNRRGYPGSTPCTDDEFEVISNGSAEQRGAFLRKQGVLLSLFIDGIIQRYALTKKGGISLIAWSQGNLFAASMLAVVDDLPLDTQERLTSYIRSCVIWDPPSVALGMTQPNRAYAPIWDDDIPLEDRGRLFAIWVSGYFDHGDLTSKDFAQLNQKDFDTKDRTPSITRMSPDEVQFVTGDIAAGVKFDTPLIIPPTFEVPERELIAKGLFDQEMRNKWNKMRMCVIYGRKSAWPMIHAVWGLQQAEEESGIKDSRLEFRPVAGANHFLMWDDPKRCTRILKECITGSTK